MEENARQKKIELEEGIWKEEGREWGGFNLS